MLSVDDSRQQRQEKQQRNAPWPTIRIPALHNPFALRVAQVFTGVGVGCGIGIGVGRPINLRAVPVLGSVAGEAVGSFSGIGYQVQGLVRKLGIKNVQAGVGCGVGVGHGFGVGLTLKPGSVEQLKTLFQQGVAALNEKIRLATGKTEQESESLTTHKTQGLSSENARGAASLQTEELLGGILKNTNLNTSIKTNTNQDPVRSEIDRLQTENKILQTLLTHQEQIEQLKNENILLKKALENENDYMPNQTSENLALLNKRNKKCFECRRKGHQRSKKS